MLRQPLPQAAGPVTPGRLERYEPVAGLVFHNKQQAVRRYHDDRQTPAPRTDECRHSVPHGTGRLKWLMPVP